MFHKEAEKNSLGALTVQEKQRAFKGLEKLFRESQQEAANITPEQARSIVATHGHKFRSHP